MLPSDSTESPILLSNDQIMPPHSWRSTRAKHLLPYILFLLVVFLFFFFFLNGKSKRLEFSLTRQTLNIIISISVYFCSALSVDVTVIQCTSNIKVSYTVKSFPCSVDFLFDPDTLRIVEGHHWGEGRPVLTPRVWLINHLFRPQLRYLNPYPMLVKSHWYLGNTLAVLQTYFPISLTFQHLHLFNCSFWQPMILICKVHNRIITHFQNFTSKNIPN